MSWLSLKNGLNLFWIAVWVLMFTVLPQLSLFVFIYGLFRLSDIVVNQKQYGNKLSLAKGKFDKCHPHTCDLSRELG